MTSQAPLQFGPVELARLAEIWRKVTPAHYAAVDQHWATQTLSDYIQPLTNPTKAPDDPVRTRKEADDLRLEYDTALRTRSSFCGLFTGDTPFFRLPHPDSVPSTAAVHCAQEVISQSRDRIIEGSSGRENWVSVYHTFVEKASDDSQVRGRAAFRRRPFIELMASPICSTLMFNFVQSTALRMAWACRLKPSNSSPVVWLGYKEWPSLNFFDRARVVLAAHEYEEYIHDAVEHRRLGLAPPSMPWHMAHTLNFNSLGHMPSLTSRQARRSRVSQQELARRWA